MIMYFVGVIIEFVCLIIQLISEIKERDAITVDELLFYIFVVILLSALSWLAIMAELLYVCFYLAFSGKIDDKIDEFLNKKITIKKNDRRKTNG